MDQQQRVKMSTHCFLEWGLVSTGVRTGVYTGIEKATGPTATSSVPLKSKSGKFITNQKKHMERWVEHYLELYSNSKFQMLPLTPSASCPFLQSWTRSSQWVNSERLLTPYRAARPRVRMKSPHQSDQAWRRCTYPWPVGFTHPGLEDGFRSTGLAWHQDHNPL